MHKGYEVSQLAMSSPCQQRVIFLPVAMRSDYVDLVKARVIDPTLAFETLASLFPSRTAMFSCSMADFESRVHGSQAQEAADQHRC